jgi:hypothetical protein
VAWTPDVDSVSSVYGLTLVENRAQASAQFWTENTVS